MRCLLLLAALLCAGCSADTVAAPARSEGEEPYTPTKVEWLVLHCKATTPNWGDLQIAYGPVNGEPNTVQIGVMVKRDTPARDIDLATKVATNGLQSYAKYKGWNWVQVKTYTLIID
jgi:hypothetical protein